MKTLKILYLVLFIGLQSCTNQQKSSPKTLTIKDFNWTITIPKDFNPVDSSVWAKTLNKGKDAIEDTMGEEVINQTTTLFIYKNGQFNNFEANWQPFDIEIDGDHAKTNSEINEMLYHTFEVQMPDAKLDSTSSTQLISGLTFYKFEMTADFPNGINMKTIGFSRLFGKQELTMNIVYVDEEIGAKMLDAFLQSTFE